MVVVGSHGWRNEIKPWSRVWAYDEWKAAVLGNQTADESTLQKFYAAQWEPADCNEYMGIEKMFGRVAKARVVVLDVEAINKRFALCLWRECAKLLTRRMTPEARKLVCEMQERVEEQAGAVG